MRNVEKYTTQYFMPPVPCYDWTKKEYVEKNPLKVLEDVYEIILDRKAHPKEDLTRTTCLTRESIRS